MRYELGNLWWLVDDQWALIGEQRYGACEWVFDTLTTKLNPSGLPTRATVNGIGYRRVVFKLSDDMPMGLIT